MEEEEMREMIREDAAQYLPFDNMEEVNFDFQILGENEYNPNQMEVLLVAARKDIIDSYTGALRQLDWMLSSWMWIPLRWKRYMRRIMTLRKMTLLRSSTSVRA